MLAVFISSDSVCIYITNVYQCGDTPHVMGSLWRNYIETPFAFEVLCEEKSIGHLGSPLIMGQWRGLWCFFLWCKPKWTSRDCRLIETPRRPYGITVIVGMVLNSIRSFVRLVETWPYKCCLNQDSLSRYANIRRHKLGLIILYCS